MLVVRVEQEMRLRADRGDGIVRMGAAYSVRVPEDRRAETAGGRGGVVGKHRHGPFLACLLQRGVRRSDHRSGGTDGLEQRVEQQPRPSPWRWARLRGSHSA